MVSISSASASNDGVDAEVYAGGGDASRHSVAESD